MSGRAATPGIERVMAGHRRTASFLVVTVCRAAGLSAIFFFPIFFAAISSRAAAPMPQGDTVAARKSAAAPGAPSCYEPSPGTASPDGSETAYGALCAGTAKGAASATHLLIYDRAGKETFRSAPLENRRLGDYCVTRGLEWIDAERVGVTCQYEPLLQQYFVVNRESGTVEQQYTGKEFLWSPDHKTLARVDIRRYFGTPEGENSCLYFGGQAAYPGNCGPTPKNTYHNVHTFVSRPAGRPTAGEWPWWWRSTTGCMRTPSANISTAS